MPDTLDTVGAVQINTKVPPSARTVVVVNVKKIIGLLAIALLIFFVVTQPDGAANSMQNIVGTLRDAADSVTRFFTRLV